MFQTFSRSWELVRISWGILRQDSELLMFPLLGFIGSIIVSVIFAIPLLASGLLQSLTNDNGGGSSTIVSIIGIVILFLYYMALSIVMTYTNVALTGAVFKRLDGDDPTLADGFSIASSHANTIIGYAAINATVGVATSLIRGAARNSNNLFGQIMGSIAAGILDAAWGVITFLAIPVIVAENAGPVDAIKRSANLLRDTWGRSLAGDISIGAVFALLTFLIMVVIGVPLMVIAFNIGSGLAIIGAIIVLVLLIIGVNLVGGALNSIFRAALYYYASDQKVKVYDEDLLRGAFRVRKGARAL